MWGSILGLAIAPAMFGADLGEMSLEDKAGQVLMVRGLQDPEGMPTPEMRTLIQEIHPGAVILYGLHDPGQVARYTDALQRWAQEAGTFPLLIGADFEFGPRMMVRNGVTAFPQEMGLGASFDPRSAFEAARITAVEARAMGVQWVFAPVADVNTNPHNPVIGVRAFGDDPTLVSGFVSEAIKGYLAGGAIPTAKHFPGHGDTSLDSHLALPRVDYDLDALDRHLEPFRAAIAAGTPAIMTAHVIVGAIDPERPATLSSRVLTGLLREKLGFRGVVITDAMNMKAIADHFGAGEAAVLALKAGADMVLSAGGIAEAREMHSAIVEAVRSGELPPSRLDEAVNRILNLKARWRLDPSFAGVFVEPGEALKRCGSEGHRAAALELARRAVTLVRDAKGWLPFAADLPGILVVGVTDAVFTLGDILGKRFPDIGVRTYRASRARASNGWTPSKFNIRHAVRLAEKEDIGAVVVLTYSSDELSPGQAGLVRSLLQVGKPVVVVATGLPYDILSTPEIPAYLAIYAQNRWGEPAPAHVPMLEALVDVLFGEVAPTGKLPVEIPGLFPRGYGLTFADDRG